MVSSGIPGPRHSLLTTEISLAGDALEAGFVLLSSNDVLNYQYLASAYKPAPPAHQCSPISPFFLDAQAPESRNAIRLGDPSRSVLPKECAQSCWGTKGPAQPAAGPGAPPAARPVAPRVPQARRSCNRRGAAGRYQAEARAALAQGRAPRAAARASADSGPGPASAPIRRPQGFGGMPPPHPPPPAPPRPKKPSGGSSPSAVRRAAVSSGPPRPADGP